MCNFGIKRILIKKQFIYITTSNRLRNGSGKLCVPAVKLVGGWGVEVLYAAQTEH